MSQRYIGGLIYNPPGGFSGYFDGSGDYLTFPNNASMPFGTGSFTIEFWINGPLNNDKFIIGGRAAIGGSLHITTGGFSSTAGALRYVGSSTITSGSVLITDGTWHHVAIVRNGSSSITLYIDGASVGTGTDTTNYTGTTGTWVIGANDFNFPSNVGSNQLNAYLSNLRIVKSAVYTAAFDPPNGPLQAITNTQLLTCAYPTFRDGSSNNFTITVNGNTAVSTQNPFPLTQLPNPALGNQGNGVYSMSQYQALRSQNLWPAIDPYFDYVTLMLHGNGTNGAQNNTFLDSSTNNFTITRNGNTTQGTFTPYGSNWSNYFDGNGDSLSYTGGSSINFGTGDFTIELWAYLTNTGTFSAFLRPDDLGTFPEFGYDFSAGQLKFQARNGVIAEITTPMPTNQWAHIVACRSGTNLRLFINGAQVGTTTTNSTNFGTTTGAIRIGGSSFSASHSVNGYLSNYRIVKGTALYTSNFTPPTAPLTAITNTSLLTCADNRFIDDSTNNFTITRNGDVSVQRFSPFNPTTPYAAGTIGGSGYFDGNGDTLSTSGGNISGTGAFTLEFWINPSLNSTQQLIYGDASNGSLYVYFFSDNLLYISNFNVANQFTSIAVARNAWTHVVIVRNSGGTYSVFLNGSRVATLSGNTTNYVSLPTVRVGGESAGRFYLGYLSDVRVSTNAALYDPTQTTITVPTAPLTAVTNTSLLLNFTNGGIIDNAMMNDLETVGNAQISTSVSKFGGGSLAFDGTGDYLVSRASTNNLYAFGTGDFTIEFWLYLNSTGQQIIWDGRPGSTTPTIYYFNSALRYYTNSADQIVGSSLATGQWYHIAISRSGTSTRMFINGTQSGSTYSDSTNYTTSTPIIGADANSGSFNLNLNGYLDDLRITKGYARYTANFTPQRSQWQDQ